MPRIGRAATLKRALSAGEEGFSLIELLVVLQILGILLLIAVPSFLTVRGKAEAQAAQSNISSAIPAAETYYQANYGSPFDADSNGLTNGYGGMTRALLVAQSQNVAPSLQIAVSPSGGSYCLQDTEGSSTYHYVGGNDASIVPHGATIFTSTCPTLP